MYKNLRDLFKQKYADDTKQPSDRSVLARQPYAMRIEPKKSSYQTYLELKHKLNVKPQPTSRPSSITRGDSSPFAKGAGSFNFAPDSERTVFAQQATFAHSRKQSNAQPANDRSQQLDTSAIITDRHGRSNNDIKVVYLNVDNNQQQIQKAFNPSLLNLSRQPSMHKREESAPKINININNLFNIQQLRQKGYLREVDNQRSPINNQQSYALHTPKSKVPPSFKENSFLHEKKHSIDRSIDTSAIKYQEIQSHLGRYKNSISKEPKETMIQTFLKCYNFPSNNNSLLKRPSVEELSTQDESIGKHNFTFIYVVGKGGFGKVWKVEYKKTRKSFAMKEMSKSKVIAKRSVSSVMNERNLLTQLKHDFIVNMVFSFQDRDNLYLVMDLMTGGDLRYHIGKLRRVKEHQTKFFVACIVLALEYLHNNNIIHRDLKPENLVLDHQGYAYLTDLGIARTLRPENSSDTSGTPGYMAPEVMCRQNHGIAADYFALGVIVYEFMMGRRPYHGRSRNEIRDQILAKQVQIKRQDVPDDYTWEAADFANRLLQRKAVNRLGFNGPDEVKQHPWLRDFAWASLKRKEMQPPFVPICIDTNAEYRNEISEDEIESNEDVIKQNQLMLRRESVQNLFAGYEKQGDAGNFE